MQLVVVVSFLSNCQWGDVRNFESVFSKSTETVTVTWSPFVDHNRSSSWLLWDHLFDGIFLEVGFSSLG